MRNSLGLFAAGLAGMVCWYAPGWWSVPGWVAVVLGAAAAFLAGYWVASPRWATVLIMMLPGLYVPIPHIFAPVYLLWSVDGPPGSMSHPTSPVPSVVCCGPGVG